MEISSNIASYSINQQKKDTIQTNFTEKISTDDVEKIKNQISQNAKEMIEKTMFAQSETKSMTQEDKFQQDYEDFQNFLKDIGYDGKPIAELTQEEASDLVSDDGFFGIEQTSDRMANFVIDGADGDEALLRAGREGMLKGYADATEAWGTELPEISQKTMDVALEKVDKAMAELGYSILDKEA